MALRSRTVLFTAIPVALLAFAHLVAGPLNPPQGLIAPTYKTLAEVEPRTPLQSLPGNASAAYVISQPGSYYLAADVTASIANGPCILITASDVTLDLSGFNVRSTSAAGIRIAGNNVTVRNGSVVMSGATSDGVTVSTGGGDVLLANLTVSAPLQCASTSTGIRNIAVRECRFIGGQSGVSLGDPSTVATLTRVECRGQLRYGMLLGTQALVEDCVVRDVGNGASSGASIRVGINGVIRRTTILDATSGLGGDEGPTRAIVGSVGLTVEDCTLFSRGSIGIDSLGSACIRKNIIKMASAGFTGVSVRSDSLIADNSINANAGTGIALDLGTTCTVIRNQLIDTTTPISAVNLGANIIGPIAGPGNPTASTNPHANYVN